MQARRQKQTEPRFTSNWFRTFAIGALVLLYVYDAFIILKFILK